MGTWQYHRKSISGALGIIIAFSILSTIYLVFITGNAIAGTETGEFCPTCPDWTNFEGWLAKKDAYDRAQQNGMQQNMPLTNLINDKPQPANSPEKETSERYKEPSLHVVAPYLGESVILDVRSPEEYQRGHIKNARNLYWRDLQKEGRLDTSLAEKEIRKVGINNSDKLLIYGGSDDGAMFAFWALSYLGKENLSLLDGGADAAWSAGLSKEINQNAVPESKFMPNIISWLSITPDNIQLMLNQKDVQIFDARDFVEYGKSKLTNKSIPLDSNKLFNGNKIKDATSLSDFLNRRNINKKSTQIVYGMPNAYSLFYALKLMGYNATLLEGDWWKETTWAVSEVKN